MGFFLFVFRNSFDANDWKKKGWSRVGGKTAGAAAAATRIWRSRWPLRRSDRERRRYSIPPEEEEEEKPIVHVQLALLVRTHDERSAPRRVCLRRPIDLVS